MLGKTTQNIQKEQNGVTPEAGHINIEPFQLIESLVPCD